MKSFAKIEFDSGENSIHIADNLFFIYFRNFLKIKKGRCANAVYNIDQFFKLSKHFPLNATTDDFGYWG